MAATLLPGQRTWSMEKDDEGHRTYTIAYRVEVGSSLDGPSVALTASGLPTIGNYWVLDNENDPWAFCTPGVKISPVVDGEPNTFFDLEYTFTTRPIRQDPTNFSDSGLDGSGIPGGGGTPSSPSGSGVENPLQIPDRVSGSFNRYTEEITKDWLGLPVLNSAHEQLRGPTVEFDKNRMSVRIEQNRSNLQLPLLLSMIDTVNDRVMWGFGIHQIKLSSAPWERKYFGPGVKYYTRTLEFEIRSEGFDREVLDEGTKALNGHWGAGGNWVLDNLGQLAAPRAPDLSVRFVADGSEVPGEDALTPDVYGYRVTATDSLAGETKASAFREVDTNDPNIYSVITVSWNEIPEASTYRVYRRNPGGEFLIAIVTAPFTSFEDDGTEAGIEASPPSTNTTGFPPDKDDPSHFKRYKDKNGENARVLLDGEGQPAELNATGTGASSAGSIYVRKYTESNFTLLGIPTTL